MMPQAHPECPLVRFCYQWWDSFSYRTTSSVWYNSQPSSFLFWSPKPRQPWLSRLTFLDLLETGNGGFGLSTQSYSLEPSKTICVQCPCTEPWFGNGNAPWIGPVGIAATQDNGHVDDNFDKLLNDDNDDDDDDDDDDDISVGQPAQNFVRCRTSVPPPRQVCLKHFFSA